MQTATLPTLNPGYSVRPCTMDDVEAVVAVMNACAVKTIGHEDETVEDIRSDWERPNFDQASSQRVVLNADGKIIAWAEAHDADLMVIHIDIYVHPDYENEGIGEYLFAWVEDRARQVIDKAPSEARVVLRGWAFSADKDVWYSALLLKSGMQLIRHFWHMDMNLDAQPPTPQWADGITLRVYDGVSDKRAIYAARRITFQDQFGNVERPFEEEYAQWLHYWESEGHFMANLWFLAMDGEKIAGICLCKPNQTGAEDQGWISTLGVLREYRRKGIGEALLYTAFDAFYKLGRKRVGLGVDASSLTGAATLYKRVGMYVAKQFDLYEKELRSGVDLTTHG